MNNNSEKTINVGGSVELALSGKYPLTMKSVVKEAWHHTMKNFVSFSPAIVVLLIVQIAILYIALQMQLGDPWQVLAMISDQEQALTALNAISIANFSYEAISAPIYVGVCMMAVSHAVGIASRTGHILRGLQYTLPVIMVTLASLILQWVAGIFVPIVPLYLTLAFTFAPLLICEKRLSPWQALWLSLRAVNKKLFVLVAIHVLLMLMFIVAIAFYGIGLIVVLPFFFHVKGVLYRQMFGVQLKVIDKSALEKGQHHSSPFFDA